MLLDGTVPHHPLGCPIPPMGPVMHVALVLQNHPAVRSRYYGPVMTVLNNQMKGEKKKMDGERENRAEYKSNVELLLPVGLTGVTSTS